MSTFGSFLELSVPTPDIGASLDFWLRLGFVEVPVNDIRPRGYAAVTDGHTVIGLQAGGLEEPALTFVRPDLARHARRLVDEGMELAFLRLDDDQFNEAGLRTPDGQLVMLLEAPTFVPSGDEAVMPLVGQCTELALGCPVPEDTRVFFESAGFLGVETGSGGPVLLSVPGLTLALHDRAARGTIALRFATGADCRERLENLGIIGRFAAGELLLTAPEGTRLVLSPPG